MPLTTVEQYNMSDEAKMGLMQADFLVGEPPRISSFTSFELLPASAVAAGTDKLTFINTGATPGTLARATKGGISYPTGGASGNASVLTGVSATAFRPTITATSKVIFAARVSIPTITNVLVQVGLGQAPSATDPGAANSGTDSAEFFFDPANALASGLGTTALGNWLVRWRSASGTVTYRDTGVPVVAGHDYNLAIAFNDSIQPVFLINRDIRAVGVALATGIVMIPQFGVKTSTAAARSFECRFAKVGRDCA